MAYLNLFDFKQKVNYKTEVLAGLTVAMTMIPESLSFAILAGLSPLTGLYAAFLMGLITAVLGGRPGMVSGGAGATVYGPLFFGSVTIFLEKFEVTNDPAEVIIDFKESRITDMSAIEALNKLTERYQKAGKKLHLRHLSPDCRNLIKNAESVIDVNVIEDPEYKVAMD